MTEQPPVPSYSKKDFMSDQMIRWCPGCGDYSILSQVQTAFASLGLPKEKFAVISGIGCSSRFPYYMSTYGFHTIHGRAPAFATGLKLANPDLSVWVVTGDGDCLSIGGNHIAHLLRRNVDLNVMLFNNRIYGLTKGQYSPTSEVGKRTKSSPMGSIDEPFNPLSFALGAGASYLARSVDVFPKHLRAQIAQCQDHEGTCFLEIMQNCNIFNDGAYSDFTDRKVRDDRVLYLEHGQPLIWGKEVKRGFIATGFTIKAVDIGEEYTEDDILIHDQTNKDLAWHLAHLTGPDNPVPVGVIYKAERPTYDSGVRAQLQTATQKLGAGDVVRLISNADTWKIE